MRGGDDGADAGLAARYGGEADAGGPQAFAEQLGGELVRGAGLTDDDRRDRRFRSADVEARGLGADKASALSVQLLAIEG